MPGGPVHSRRARNHACVSVIVARAPLRVALGGGGTDLPSHYRRRGGFVVSAAIDKYIHMVTSLAFRPRYVLKHLEEEEAETPEEIRHPILRAALSRHWDGRPLEIASASDVPPGTGLGSSGAYTVCVLKSLELAAGRQSSPAELAEAACEIEIDVLGRTVGKQDQYAAAHGGVRAYTFNPDDSVDARPLELADEARRALRDEFLLFYTGGERSASDVLSHQVSRTLAGDEEVERNLARTEELARATCAALEAGELDRLADLMDEQWEVKRARAPGAVPPEVEELRRRAKRAGALGVMLVGAGGGGFLLAYAPAPEKTRTAMEEAGAPELHFDVDEEGCAAVSPPP
jgi:D-glycero-alpha-D-manno-heptose-7-phosphate kinase